MNKNKFRLAYFIIFIFLLGIEVFIALFIHDNIIRPYIGDIIVVPVVYSFIRIFIPQKLKFMPLYVFIFAVLVEIMQYIDIVSILHLENNAFLRTVIGTSFSWADIICYFIGSIPLAIWELRCYLKNK